jgi:hypothetical protein
MLGAVVGLGSNEPFSQGIYVVSHLEEVVQFITENKIKYKYFTFYQSMSLSEADVCP